MQTPRWFSRLALLATVLAGCVVVVGAFTRLVDAGLSCPDWPGCYGYLTVPSSTEALALAEQRYPEQPVEVAKAWAEMGHRYLAGTLGLLIFALTFFAWRYRRAENPPPFGLTLFLSGFVIFQALLGMWTVTLLLVPTVVMAHLLGGMSIFALLCLLTLRTANQGRGLWASGNGNIPVTSQAKGIHWLKPWIIIGITLVLLQIFLGGWTSANYAALSCPDFPTCQGYWLPPLDFNEAFNFLLPLGPNYEGGLFDNDARVTIHFMHRIGALIVTVYLLLLAALLWRSGSGLLRKLALVMLLVLAAQVMLGIFNVIWLLPLSLAVAHNAVAALLLITLISIAYSTYTLTF